MTVDGESPLPPDELASYFGVAPEIVEFVPELLADFTELGSDPELIVGWLRDADLTGEQKRVLDLGCGKGAVSIAIAQMLGCHVDGVDALPAFVEAARSRSREADLDKLCVFEVGDLRDTVRSARGYDVVLLVSVGVLGTPADLIEGCRQCVEPGGLMILDHAYSMDSDRIEFGGYAELATREETLRQLTSFGDHLVLEHIAPVGSVREQNDRYTRRIERRVEELSTAHPEHAEAFAAYLVKEIEECSILETRVTCATWMLRRK